jgi:hypothetical protein
MNVPVSAILVRLCAVLVGVIAIVVVLQLATTQAFGASSSSSDLFSTSANSPNVITSSMISIAGRIGSAAIATVKSMGGAMASIGSFIGNGAASGVHGLQHAFGSTGRTSTRIAGGGTRPIVLAVTTSTQFVGRLAVGTVSFYFRSIGDSLGFMGRAAVGMLSGIGGFFNHVGGAVSNTVTMSTLIRPADKKSVPEIDSPDVMTVASENYVQARAPAPPKTMPAPATTMGPPRPVAVGASASVSLQWPIHGAITTLFGADDMPFELHHTGIDISDGKPAGLTPIKPFKPGKVINVEHSDVSYGNHVIVDNGGGVTSWYAHMYATAVQVGQQVDENTVLGYEGDTGAATGVHLHFEIRINNIPMNPQNFIMGNP